MARVAIVVRRAYDPVSHTDGTRFLVERLWPRGISKAKLRADAWLKEVGPAPSCGNGSATTHEVEGVPSAVLLKQLRMSFANPARIARRHLFDLGIGADSLLHTDRTKLRVRFSVINLTNTDAL